MDNKQQAASNNSSLHAAKRKKNDEFYTRLTDIEKEVKHYRKHFKGKTVYCNCDDPYISAFFDFFSKNFEALGLKKLITTCYKSARLDLFSQNGSDQAVMLVYEGGAPDNTPTVENIGVIPLKGDGDFRSAECVAILRGADIVVTNPPFSLFREYIAQLIEHDKKFLIIGNQNAITYKETFQLIMDNVIWTGVDNGGTKWFQVPDDYEIKTESRIKIVDGVKYFSMGSIYWFTNLDTQKRHEDLTLYRTYQGHEDSYPKYDGYDAINIDRVDQIPLDYAGLMGVPITFVDKYNPKQFEILGLDRYIDGNPTPGKRFTIDGKEKYARVVVRNISL